MIEIATFRLRPDVDGAAFLAADEAVQQRFAYRQPGIVRRTTAAADDGTWAVITHWASPEHVEAAREAAVSSDEVAALAALVEPTSVEVRRFRPLP